MERSRPAGWTAAGWPAAGWPAAGWSAAGPVPERGPCLLTLGVAGLRSADRGPSVSHRMPRGRRGNHAQVSRCRQLHQGGRQGPPRRGRSARRAATEAMIKSLGGTMEAYYFAFGSDDFYIIVDAPSNAAVAAAALTAAASGAVNPRTVALSRPRRSIPRRSYRRRTGLPGPRSTEPQPAGRPAGCPEALTRPGAPTGAATDPQAGGRPSGCPAGRRLLRFQASLDAARRSARSRRRRRQARRRVPGRALRGGRPR